MQPLARDGLTAAQVTTLLTGTPDLQVKGGADLLNADLSFAADISDDVLDGKVSRTMGTTVHGTCRLRLSRSLSWGTALVRPYVVLSSRGVTARFNLGVFSPATPERLLDGSSLETYDVSGYDRLYLLDRPVGDSYNVAAGTGYLAAVRSAVTDAGLSGVNLDSSAEAKTLPTAAVWPLIGENNPTTWLRIVNDLLAAVGYRGLYADENGFYRSEPYVNPAARPVEFTFTATGPASSVGESRADDLDLWAVPNKWVFVQQNSATEPVLDAGIYVVTNDDPASPTSTVSRGLTWPRVERLDAADHAALVTRGDGIVAADKQVSRVLKVSTVPFPAAGHADVFTYIDPQLGTLRVTARRWEVDLLDADTQWYLEVVA